MSAELVSMQFKIIIMLHMAYLYISREVIKKTETICWPPMRPTYMYKCANGAFCQIIYSSGVVEIHTYTSISNNDKLFLKILFANISLHTYTMAQSVIFVISYIKVLYNISMVHKHKKVHGLLVT